MSIRGIIALFSMSFEPTDPSAVVRRKAFSRPDHCASHIYRVPREEKLDRHKLREVLSTKERPQYLLNILMKQTYRQSYNISIYNDEFSKELACFMGFGLSAPLVLLHPPFLFGSNWLHISGAKAVSNRRQTESRSWCLE